MLKNHLRTSWRNLMRTKALAVIYLTGLSVSVAAAMPIFVWIRYELSFDRSIPNAENIYRIYPHIYMHGNNFTSSMAPPPLTDLLKKEFAGSGFIALEIAIATVSLQALGAALANPVSSLRSE